MILEGKNSLGSDEEGESSEMEEDNVTLESPQNAIETSLSLIVTNLSADFFDDQNSKTTFELMFQPNDNSATFQYFRSFRRVRVNYTNHDEANAIRTKMHLTEICGSIIKCFFRHPIVLESSHTGDHLQPPKRERNFLISPPASPPLDWEPADEAQPLVNYDLLNAVASLAPGESHELHPSSDEHPGIIVHICEEAIDDGTGPKLMKIPTKCPNRPS